MTQQETPGKENVELGLHHSRGLGNNINFRPARIDSIASTPIGSAGSKSSCNHILLGDVSCLLFSEFMTVSDFEMSQETQQAASSHIGPWRTEAHGHLTTDENGDPKTDYSRWRLLDDRGRQTWHYLESEKENNEWPQSVADKYHLGLPTVYFPSYCFRSI